MFKTRKVVIVGAGHVGSHVALALIQSGEADDIVLIDILKEKAIGQALDPDAKIPGMVVSPFASVLSNPRSSTCSSLSRFTIRSCGP